MNRLASPIPVYDLDGRLVAMMPDMPYQQFVPLILWRNSARFTHDYQPELLRTVTLRMERLTHGSLRGEPTSLTCYLTEDLTDGEIRRLPRAIAINQDPSQ